MIYDNDNLPQSLEVGDEVHFHLLSLYHDASVLMYKVRRRFLNIANEGLGYDLSNSSIFNALAYSLGSGFGKETFCKQFYGYTPNGGSWPECRDNDYAALTRLVNGIFEKLKGTGGRIEVAPQVKVNFTNILHTLAIFGGVQKTPANLDILITLSRLGVVHDDGLGYRANPGLDLVKIWDWSKDLTV